MEEGKKYWWITMEACGHFRTLKVKDRIPKPGEIMNENWQDSIFFDNEEDALSFLESMKEMIKKNYIRARDKKWYNK